MISQWLEEREASPFTDEETVILTFLHSPKVTQVHLFPEPSCHPHLQGCKEAGFYADLRMLAKNNNKRKPSWLTIYPFALIILFIQQSLNTVPLHYPKVERSSETFPKPQWHKLKKQLPEDTSCSQMHGRNGDKAQMLSDTVQSSGRLTLRY